MDFDFYSAMEAAQTDAAEADADIAEETIDAEPQEQPDLETGDQTQEELSAEPEQNPGEQVQTAEQRAGYAAARRRAEAEWQTQKQAADAFYQRMDTMAKARGFKNIEELEQAVNAEAEARRVEDYKQKYGIDPNAVKPLVEDAVNNHPVVQAAKQAEAQAKIAAGRKALNDAVAEIGKLDDRIKSFDDLPKMDNYELFDDMVRNRGYRMVDAYKLANMDRLQEKRAAAASQEVRNSINSRSHLKQTGGDTGGNAVVVPAEVMAAYRAIIPNATDAEIRKHWAANNKS